MTPIRDTRTVNEWPTYWFVRLERAVDEGDHEAAAEAQRELLRLGVHVRYGRPTHPVVLQPRTRQGARDA